MAEFAPQPVTLSGRIVRLEPLTLDHVDALCGVGLMPELWQWTTTRIATREDMLEYVHTALEWQREGTAVPFATVAAATGLVIGSTRFANIDRPHRRLEIGWTWVTPAWQKSGANIEAKLLMLEYAFERLGAVRVEFKTDSLNQTSRRALLGIGAVEEGTLRNHMIAQQGRLRHSVYYSVLPAEWAAVKSRLLQRLLAAPRP